MGQAIKPELTKPRDAIDDQVDEAIEMCGGDARKAVRGLILGQKVIEGEIAKIAKIVSAGYVRRRLH